MTDEPNIAHAINAANRRLATKYAEGPKSRVARFSQ